MKKTLLRLGYIAIAFTERGEPFFGQNFLRMILVVYFKLCLYIITERKFDIYLRIGTLYLNLNNLCESKEYYKSALEIEDGDEQKTRALMCLGNFYFKCKLYEKAIEFYNDALLTTRYRTTIYSNLAYLYEEVGEYNKSLEYAERSLEISKMESDLGHTISPEDNVKGLVIRMKEKLSNNIR